MAPGGAVAILGMAYKLGTPVVEESQGVILAAELAQNHIPVTIHDPLALENARIVLGEAVHGAAVIVIATPDPSFRAPGGIVEQQGGTVVIVDCWRLLPAAPSRAHVISVGRH